MESEKKQTPTIGRIVIFNAREEDKEVMRMHARRVGCNVSDKLPATIVSVHGEELVNVKVHLDGDVPDLWVTSIEKGDEKGQWNWPPRV